jgi:ABC-type antimicrobial peptide transport system permease subunit
MFAEHGRDDLVVFLRPGATSEGESNFPRDRAEILVKETPEIAIAADGQPLGSGELYLAVRRFKLDGGETNVPIRGVQQKTFDIHGDSISIVEGRRFEPGTDEIIVGRNLGTRIRDCRVDDVLMINTTPFRVVGVFAGKGGQNSELWGDVDRLMEALERRSFSRVIAQVKPRADVVAMAQRLEDDKRVPAKLMVETEYLASQTTMLSGLFIGLGGFLALVMGIAAIFTGTNAMFSQIAARMNEIGILLSMGFRPFAIFFAFLCEAALLGLLGGVVGCLMVLPLNGVQTGTMNMQTFSEVVFAFRMTPTVVVSAVIFAIVLGLIGGAVPAWRAARMSPTTALRRH